MILARLEHRLGVRRGTAALADALRVRGFELSAPMAFGLGAELGRYHRVSPESSARAGSRPRARRAAGPRGRRGVGSVIG